MNKRASSSKSSQSRLSAHANHIRVFVEPSVALPVVDMTAVWLGGSLSDPGEPRDQEGLARLWAETVRMGPRGMSAEVFEETLAMLGAEFSVEVSGHTVRFHGSVLSRHLEAFFALFARVIRDPALRKKDFMQAKRNTKDALRNLTDDDQALVGRQFHRALFEGHLYGRSRLGSMKSVGDIHAADLKRRPALKQGDLLVGFAGDIRESLAHQLVETAFGDLPRRRSARVRIPATKLQRGRRVYIVDKPARTQVQMYIGTLGSRWHDPCFDPLLVANTVFGGTFTSRLTHEVRSMRGYSYGASSRLGRGIARDAWSMSSSPNAEVAVDCAQLQLYLLDMWVQKGVRRKEMNNAKRFLINSHCFERETASSRLGLRLDTAVLGLEPDYFERFPQRIRAVTQREANEAVQKRISSKDLVIVIVADAAAVEKDMAALPGVTSLEVVDYHALV